MTLEETDDQDNIRLQKVLARLGFGSRRTCENMISAGRVKVNGAIAELGRRVDLTKDAVEVDNIAVSIEPDLVYYLVNKPAGTLVSAHDPEGRPLLIDILPASPRVFSVGRLDYATEGLIIFTNDGKLAHALTHPSSGVEKEYLAQTYHDPSNLALRQLREGVEIEPGVITLPAKVGHLSPCLVKITICEGRNRQVRRMFEEAGYPVKRLVRTRIGPITDTALSPGHWRFLSVEEVRLLSYASSNSPKRAKL
ncbi:MAG: rRNA pseudouridine synthase [Firmicutes bacterium]|jgi:23S rRNA pseudouridine2605 synthase|nr:rRNA pseudouridine synthase [Bacillota bacterium]